MKQSVSDHKPAIDRLNKTGGVLLKLVGDDDAERIRELMDQDNSRFDGIKTDIRERTNTLDEALQQTSEVMHYESGNFY